MPEIDTVYRFQRSSFIASDEGRRTELRSRPLEGGFFYFGGLIMVVLPIVLVSMSNSIAFKKPLDSNRIRA